MIHNLVDLLKSLYNTRKKQTKVLCTSLVNPALTKLTRLIPAYISAQKLRVQCVEIVILPHYNNKEPKFEGIKCHISINTVCVLEEYEP